MDYFGDESGHLRNVLTGDDPVCVVAVVAGDRISCGRCPKQTVRRVDDIPEAKWNDLMEVQKRRFLECLSDCDHVEYGYVLLTRDMLESLDSYHLLYQDVDLPPSWDLALNGYAYGEILFELGAGDDRRPTFEFDRIASRAQSERVGDHISEFVPDVQVFVEGSRQSSGIQAADCLAGAVAEDHKHGTDWLGLLEDNLLIRCGQAALIQLENDLTSYRTGP